MSVGLTRFRLSEYSDAELQQELQDRRKEVIKALVAELRHQRQGWRNAIEVGLITGEYMRDAKNMIESISVALAKAGVVVS